MTELSEKDEEDIKNDEKFKKIIEYFDGNYERFVEDISKEGKFDYDKMKEIVSLSKSQDVEDRLKSLDLIQSVENKCPLGFEANFFIAMKKDSDQRVQEKANSLQKKQRAEAFKAISKPNNFYRGLYGSVFKDITSNLISTSLAFDQSQNIAKQLSTVINNPIGNIDHKDFSVFSGINLEHLIPKMNFEGLYASTSPITAIQPIIHPIITQEFPEHTLSEVLGKTSSEIAEELEKISIADEDIIFNYEAYRLIYDLERFLRDLIYERICIKHKKNIKTKIHESDLEKWKDRKKTEEMNPLLKKGYRLIDYSDFSDLKRILEKGKNHKEFSDLLNNEQFRDLISKLDELDPIRKKIAHSRPLSKKEFDRVQLYADDITQFLNQANFLPESDKASKDSDGKENND